MKKKFSLLFVFISCFIATTIAQTNIQDLLNKAQQGDSNAQCKLGVCYYTGRDVPQDYEKAVSWFLKAADNGDLAAVFNLGHCYENGTGVPKNLEQAISWYTKAAEKGEVTSQLALGNRYYNGIGVTKDYTKAVFWLNKAADKGNVEAQYKLGNCYSKGHGVDTDDKKAVYWYTKAAEQGHLVSQYNLGFFYSWGIGGLGVDTDDKKSAYWYGKAAEQGAPIPQKEYGDCFYNGRGVPKDYAKAVFWYKKSAEQGNADAQQSLGYCYENGEGVKKDISIAKEWFNKAIKNGKNELEEHIKDLERKERNALANALQSYSDAKYFGLKGKVKKCKWSDNIYPLKNTPWPFEEILFSPKGEIISEGCEFDREVNGRIIEMTKGVSTYKFYYDSQNRINCIEHTIFNIFGDDEVQKYYYSYNPEGRIVSSNNKLIVGCFDNVYSNFVNDSMGNWVKCTINNSLGTKTLTREIEYY